MQVILLERVAKLGQMGDVVDVKPGFARNFLLPQGKALTASEANVASFESQKAQLEARNLETKKEAETSVKLFFDSLSEALASGDRVEIRGLCSFYVKDYKGYTGRNPRTGDKVEIKSKKLPFFKPGKELKERVDK